MDYRGKVAIVTGASSGIGRETAKALADRGLTVVAVARRIVVEAIFEVTEKKRREITVPKRNLALISARILRSVAPSLLRSGMARMGPVPDEVIERARARAQEQRARVR